MRHMLFLTAALLAADAELAGSASDVQASAPSEPPSDPAANEADPAAEQPPVDNDHVASGCEQFADVAHSAVPSSSSSSSPAGTAAAVPAPPASSSAAAASPPPTPAPQVTMGRIVHVRDHHGHAAPGIVVRVHENGTIDAQIFRADHAVHAAEGLREVTRTGTARGWFWPPRG